MCLIRKSLYTSSPKYRFFITQWFLFVIYIYIYIPVIKYAFCYKNNLTYYVQYTDMKTKHCDRSKEYLGFHVSICCVHFKSNSQYVETANRKNYENTPHTSQPARNKEPSIRLHSYFRRL